MEAVSKQLDAPNSEVAKIADEAKDLRAERRKEPDQRKTDELDKDLQELTRKEEKLNVRRVDLEKSLQSLKGTHPLAITPQSRLSYVP